jgi:hypothetical protein
MTASSSTHTVHSLAWLDLSEQIVFSHPDMGSRFYLFEMVDPLRRAMDPVRRSG